MAALTQPTLDQLINNVRLMLNQPDPNNSFWGDEELTNYINEGARRYFQEVVQNLEGYFTTKADLDLVANNEEVALPSDFYQVKALYMLQTDFYELLSYQNNITDNYTTVPSSTGTYSPYYFLRGNKVVLRPMPGEARTGALRLEYIYLPDTMVNGGDQMTAQVAPVFKDLVEMYAVYKAKLKESLVGGGNSHIAAGENVQSLYDSFKTAIRNRSKYPTYTVPFNPEEN